MPFLEKIETYITKHALIKRDSTIIIGLSGGPDSVFLLHTLKSLQEKYNLTLIAAHLNHEWRPEADAEEQMCHSLAQKLDMSFVSAKMSSLPMTTKKYRGSKEEYARNMRRYFLEQVLREHNAHSIALGHHAQDQQETFFIRLIRGTSLAGLTCMYPLQDLYIRPLLEINKSDILQWLKENNIEYATDASNESDNYLRNRIRKYVIPALAHCDERWNNNFLATINRLKEDDALLNDIATSALNDVIIKKDNEDVFDIKKFETIHPSLHHRVIILWLIRSNLQFPVTQAFLDEIIRFLLHERGGKHVIHEEWMLVKKQGLVWVVRR